jgi:hypothetical protein
VVNVDQVVPYYYNQRLTFPSVIVAPRYKDLGHNKIEQVFGLQAPQVIMQVPIIHTDGEDTLLETILLETIALPNILQLLYKIWPHRLIQPRFKTGVVQRWPEAQECDTPT